MKLILNILLLLSFTISTSAAPITQDVTIENSMGFNCYLLASDPEKIQCGSVEEFEEFAASDLCRFVGLGSNQKNILAAEYCSSPVGLRVREISLLGAENIWPIKVSAEQLALLRRITIIEDKATLEFEDGLLETIDYKNTPGTSSKDVPPKRIRLHGDGFLCPDCGKAFKSSGGLRIHKKVEHADGFQCPDRHLKKVHPETSGTES